MINNEIWLIGTGQMSEEYVKVLKALNVQFTVIGRNVARCSQFFKNTGIMPIQGGVERFLSTNPHKPKAVINAAGIDALSFTTKSILNFGAKYILLEKPGFGNPNELDSMVQLANNLNAKILLAYNRRFYQSVIKAKDILMNDGGVKSFHFEFTEWSHSIEKLEKTIVEKEFWFYGNSTHIIDLAFYLGGLPKTMHTYKKGNLPWHPSGSIFAGSGETEIGAFFSYIANWEAPGRWGLELCSDNYRLIFRPIEKLQIMKKGSTLIEQLEGIDYLIDENYKPGLFMQTKCFLMENIGSFKDINQQLFSYESLYKKINN